jgi:hypothetical protein
MSVGSIDAMLILAVIFFSVFFISSIAVLAFYFINSKKVKQREERSLDSVLLQIALPRGNEIKVDAMEQLFSSLYSVKESVGVFKKHKLQPAVSFEIVAKEEEIRFFIWTPRAYRDLIEKQVHGSYPDAEIREVPEYNIFTETGKVAYKALQQKNEIFYPIKTFKELPVDPLAAITSSMAKMAKGESAAIQVLISSVDSSWQKWGSQFISNTKKQESDPEKAKYSTPAKTLEAVENKISKPGFEVSIRIVCVSDSEHSARTHLENIMGGFQQFSGELNSFKARIVRMKASFIEDFLYRYHPVYNFWGNKAMILNSEELASVFHFPNKQITTPHLHWLNAKTAPAPAEIPTEGIFMGVSNYRGIKRPVFMSKIDRQRHMYMVGKTGTGKSEYLKELILQDIKEGEGVCFLDPHGDAVEEILELIPPERAEDVIYFKPSDLVRPMGLNLLEAKTEDQKHFVTTSIINLMYKLFDPYKTGIVGPRFEHAVRNAMLTVMSDEGTTFIEVMRVLTDPNYVREILPKVQDPIVRRYWTDQIAQTSDFHKSEVLDYITSKFGRFVTNKMIRNIIGQSQSSFNFRKIMDDKKILLVNLSKGELGEENSSFLGLILVPRILMAAMSRADVPKEQRTDFYLYVDEFQNFATPDFEQILSEARKYKLNLIVANQFVGQIDDGIKNAIFGNVGTIVSFRVGVTDANYLAREFAPTFGEDDLLNIERFHVYIKTIVNNEPVPPFSMDLTKDVSEIDKTRNPRVAEIIQEMSRLKYGRDIRLVESEIGRRAKL